MRLLAVLGKPVDWVSTSSERLLVIFYKFFDSSIPCCRISLGCPLPAEVGEPISRRLLAVDSLCAALYRRKSMSLQSVDSSTPCCQLTFGCPLTADIHESAICRLVDSLLSTRSGLPFTGGNVTVYKLSTRRLAAAASQIQALYRD